MSTSKLVGLDTVSVLTVGDVEMLARVSIVDERSNTIYDEFVKPNGPIIDYQYHKTGLDPDILDDGKPFGIVRKEVQQLVQDKILVGYDVINQLKVLGLTENLSNVSIR